MEEVHYGGEGPHWAVVLTMKNSPYYRVSYIKGGMQTKGI